MQLTHYQTNIQSTTELNQSSQTGVKFQGMLKKKKKKKRIKQQEDFVAV